MPASKLQRIIKRAGFLPSSPAAQVLAHIDQSERGQQFLSRVGVEQAGDFLAEHVTPNGWMDFEAVKFLAGTDATTAGEVVRLYVHRACNQKHALFSLADFAHRVFVDHRCAFGTCRRLSALDSQLGFCIEHDERAQQLLEKHRYHTRSHQRQKSRQMEINAERFFKKGKHTHDKHS